MNKIGIITLFGNYNYGNRLQNYAVQKLFEACGCEVETIVCQGSRMKCALKSLREFVRFVGRDKKAVRQVAFQAFNKKYLNIRYEYAENRLLPARIKRDYDFFVVGSDQVWNPEIRKKERHNFFLRFADSSQKLCIAPSIGVSEIGDEYAEDYRRWLHDFRYLSCREDVGAKEIERITQRECLHLIDPTLAVPAETWRMMEEVSAIPPEPYMVMFFLGDVKEEVRKQCSEIAKEQSLRIIEPTAPDDMFYTMSPQQFLALIDHAVLVCTDSFHAGAFSINFNTPFCVFDRSDKKVEANHMSSRIQSLVRQFGLENRYLTEGRPLSIECDFEDPNRILAEKRKEAREYIQRCLAK